MKNNGAQAGSLRYFPTLLKHVSGYLTYKE